MGFWEQQVEELTRSIDALLGQHGPAPQSTGEGGSSPGPLLPPAEPYTPPPTDPPPNYPPGSAYPYAPPMPRSAIDNLHATRDAPYPMPRVMDPHALGPSQWDEIAPGMWTPPGSADAPLPVPGAVHPASWSGTAADSAQEAAQSVQRVQTARWEADRSVAEQISALHEAAAQTRHRLAAIRDNIQQGVAALRPSMDTRAGQTQLADFLQSKATELQQVIQDAQGSATTRASRLGDALTRYVTT